MKNNCSVSCDDCNNSNDCDNDDGHDDDDDDCDNDDDDDDDDNGDDDMESLQMTDLKRCNGRAATAKCLKAFLHVIRYGADDGNDDRGTVVLQQLSLSQSNTVPLTIKSI